MNKQSIVLWSLIISYCLLGQYAFANNEDIYGDCRQSTVGWYKAYTNIYPESLILLAQNNLQKYCCKNKTPYLTEQQQSACKDNKSEYYVDSPRLYDHLIDVGMRYLDGDETLQYKTSQWAVVLDTKGKERREFVTQYGDTPTGRIPLELQQKYTEYRGTMIEDFEIWDSISTSCEESKGRFDTTNTARNTTSLSKKYFVMCELSSCMVDGKKNNRINACHSLVTQRIIWERDYVQWLLLYQSSLGLSTNFEAYAWYINHDMFTALLEKIVMMSKWLGFVNNKVNEMTRMCSA